jgi:LysM repeat protein
VVAPGDTVWSIAASHFAGDPRPHVEAILVANHLRSPMLTPGESLRIPQE